MVGVPKSNRCTFCKARKTKCDEKWPTCGACARAGKACSGARNNFKFIVNGCHNESATATITTTTLAGGDGGDDTTRRYRSKKKTTANKDSRQCGAGRHERRQQQQQQQQHSSRTLSTMVDLKEFSKGNCSFYRMRLSPYSSPLSPYTRTLARLSPLLARLSPAPSPPMTTAGALAASFVACLDAAPRTGNDLKLLGPSLRMIPQHLIGNDCGGGSGGKDGGGSVVLQHAVELVVTCWTNSRKGLLPSSWLDLRVYNRALRSLHDALNDSSHMAVTHTLAALALLQKVEILYDFERGSNCENHAAGLIAVVSKGGPWQGFSEFGLHLTFDSYYYMLQEDIRLGRESEFVTHEWINAFEKAIDTSTIRPVLKSTYHLWVKMTHWPTLVQLVRSLCQRPCDTMTAAELSRRVMPLIDYLSNEDATTIAFLKESGGIFEVENTLRPDLFSTCYEFSDYDTAKFFTFHALFGIICCRALQQANRILARDDLTPEKRCRELSKRIWMSHAWMKTRRPLAVDFTGPLAFSYESANSSERQFCIDGLEDMEYFRRPPPIGKWIDATIMANVKGYSGRTDFVTSQDINVELQGIGCRCRVSSRNIFDGSK